MDITRYLIISIVCFSAGICVGRIWKYFTSKE
nr:MAG TPA: hypothetical protein [Caudoviricetes sp.]